jgi:hypothetical protein
MPALDEFLNAQSPEQVALFDSREVRNVEGASSSRPPKMSHTAPSWSCPELPSTG